MKLTQPLKWHGGKAYLASKIVALMPPRCNNPNKPADDDPGYLHYVEPYFGGGSVLLANNPEGISEVANDLNGNLTNFWHVLANQRCFTEFHRIVQAVPFSKPEYEAAATPGFRYCSIPIVDEAAKFFVRCRQSLAGRMKGFTGITKTRTRRGMNNEVSAWLTCIEGLPAVHNRLKRVLILNDKARKVIRDHDGPRTLFYLDPPYLHETRATTGEYGDNEMTLMNHLNLLVTLGGVKAARVLACYVEGEIPKWWGKAEPIEGRFLLSGYPSGIYKSAAAACGWNRHEFEVPNQAAGGKKKRRMTECVWTNY